MADADSTGKHKGQESCVAAMHDLTKASQSNKIERPRYACQRH